MTKQKMSYVLKPLVEYWQAIGLENRAKVFEALVKITKDGDTLFGRPATLQKICELSGIGLSAVNNHVKVLVKAGIIAQYQRHGTSYWRVLRTKISIEV